MAADSDQTNSVGADLPQQIRQAFPALALKKADDIVHPGRWIDEAGAMQTYADPEAQAVGAFLVGVPWPQLVGKPLLEWPPAASSLVWLTPQGLARYLPAYLCTFLEAQSDGIAHAILDAVVSRLLPPEGGGTGVPVPDHTRSELQRQSMLTAEADAFDAFCKQLTAPQAKVVARFLGAVAPLFDDDWGENRARLALDRYWNAHASD